MGELVKVEYGIKFKAHLKNFPVADQLKIKAFVEHIEQFGFDGLQGRNKSSDDVPVTHPNWSERIIYAKTHNLWHYLRAEKAKHRFARSQDKGYARSGHSQL